MHALSVLCAQLTRDLLAIAKFLFYRDVDKAASNQGDDDVALCTVCHYYVQSYRLHSVCLSLHVKTKM